MGNKILDFFVKNGHKFAFGLSLSTMFVTGLMTILYLAKLTSGTYVLLGLAEALMFFFVGLDLHKQSVLRQYKKDESNG